MVNVSQSIEVAKRLLITSKERRQPNPCYETFSRAITTLVKELKDLDSLLKQCGVDYLPAFEERPLILRILGDFDKTLEDCEKIVRRERESVEDQVKELEARITLHNLKLKALSLSKPPVPPKPEHPDPLHGSDLAIKYIDAEVTRSRARRLGRSSSTQTAAEALRTAFDATTETLAEDSAIRHINALVRHLSAAANGLENVQERVCGILWVRLMTCSRSLAAVAHFNASRPSDPQSSRPSDPQSLRKALLTGGITLQGLITVLEMELYRCLQVLQDSLPQDSFPSIETIKNLARSFAWMVPDFEDDAKPSKEYILCSYLTRVHRPTANWDQSGPLVVGLQRFSDHVLSIDLPTTSNLRLDKINLRSIRMCPSYATNDAINDAQKIELTSDDVHLSFKHMSDLCCFQQAITGYRVVHYVHRGVKLGTFSRSHKFSGLLSSSKRFFEGNLQLWLPEVLSAPAKAAFGRPSPDEDKSHGDMQSTYNSQGDQGFYTDQPYPPLLVFIGGGKSENSHQETFLLSFKLDKHTGTSRNDRSIPELVQITHNNYSLEMTEYVSSKTDKVDLAVLGRQHQVNGDRKVEAQKLRWIQLDFRTEKDREVFTDYFDATHKRYIFALKKYNKSLKNRQSVMS